MPPREAFQIEVEVLIGKTIAKLLVEAGAEIPLSRSGHEVVNQGLSMRPRDHGVGAGEIREAEVRRRPFACHTTHESARPEDVADVQGPCQLPNLEPEQTG